MTRLVVVMVVGLALPGAGPALALAGRSAAAVFLAPVVGATLAGIAAGSELAIGGTEVAWYLLLAVLANVAALAWWRGQARRVTPTGPASGAGRSSWGWTGLTVAVIAAALALASTGLETRTIGYDANVIWLTHALLVSGGHDLFRSGLRNPAYGFTNPNYPPLVPAAEALYLSWFGRGDLLGAVRVTVALNAAAVGLVAAGVAECARRTSRAARAASLVVAAAVCLTAFTAAGGYGVNGYADLLWAAEAAGAVLWGLVLPRSSRSLAVAWACAAAASLSKNEGLTTSLVILVVISLRTLPVHAAELRWRTARRRRQLARWAARIAMVLGPALPGLAWLVLSESLGLTDNFFGQPTAGSAASRVAPTLHALSANLAVALAGVAVLVAGSLFLRRDRRRGQLGNPAWFWVAWTGSLAVIAGTYVFGDLPVHWWLSTSVTRTTIFARLAVYADLGIWIVTVVNGLGARPGPELQPPGDPVAG